MTALNNSKWSVSACTHLHNITFNKEEWAIPFCMGSICVNEQTHALALYIAWLTCFICFVWQSETILKFTFFICKNLNPFSPSLSQIKSIQLPGYSPPSQVGITCMINFRYMYNSVISNFSSTQMVLKKYHFLWTFHLL